MKRLFQLFALVTLDLSASEFLLSSRSHRSTIPKHLLDPIFNDGSQTARRPLSMHGQCLITSRKCSGRYGGDVYNDLFRRAHTENPLNQQTFNVDWRSEEIVIGEREEAARQPIEALALGSARRE